MTLRLFRTATFYSSSSQKGRPWTYANKSLSIVMCLMPSVKFMNCRLATIPPRPRHSIRELVQSTEGAFLVGFAKYSPTIVLFASKQRQGTRPRQASTTAHKRNERSCSIDLIHYQACRMVYFTMS